MNDQFQTLINQYVEGSANAEQMAELEHLLRTDEHKRAEFIEFMNLESALTEAAVGWQVDQETPTPTFNAGLYDQDEVAAGRLKLSTMLSLAACLLFVIAVGYGIYQPATPSATVTGSIGNNVFVKGAEVGSGRHRIEQGSVELVTALGARIVIEAPATFEFLSAQKLHLLKGRVAADVPKAARGFTVSTSRGDAVDLGTQFGVDVPETGDPEVHVFDGEVVTHSNDGAKKSVLGGQAVKLLNQGSASRELRSAAFILPDEAAELSANMSVGRVESSQRKDQSIKRDAALIAYLDFENTGQHDGQFRVVQGRWPGTSAAEFVNVGEHLKVNVGGAQSWEQFTIAAWVRIDRMGAPYQSILHTNGWGENKPGQVHWMINRDTTMRLALFGNTLAPGSTEQHDYPDSSTPVLHQQGRWVHLVTVYDARKQTVRFYLNGQFDKETKQAIAHPARFGPAQIGNWDRDDRKLSGRIDELFIVGRAMTDEEIKAIFVAGDPYGRTP